MGNLVDRLGIGSRPDTWISEGRVSGAVDTCNAALAAGKKVERLTPQPHALCRVSTPDMSLALEVFESKFRGGEKTVRYRISVPGGYTTYDHLELVFLIGDKENIKAIDAAEHRCAAACCNLTFVEGQRLAPDKLSQRLSEVLSEIENHQGAFVDASDTMPTLGED